MDNHGNRNWTQTSPNTNMKQYITVVSSTFVCLGNFTTININITYKSQKGLRSKPRTCQIIIKVAPLQDLSIKSGFNGHVCLVFRQKLGKSELLAVSHRDLDVYTNPI